MNGIRSANPDNGSGASGANAPAASRAWTMTAWVAGLFSLLLGLGMLGGRIHTKAYDPLKSPLLKRYKEELRANPSSEDLKKHIRQLDLELRQTYFRQLSRTNSGVYMLVGGLGVFVFAVTRRARYHRQLPCPKATIESAERASHRAKLGRWSVAASASGIGLLLFLVARSGVTPLPGTAAEIDKLLAVGEVATSDCASIAEMRQNWPRFLGPEGNGAAGGSNAPASWDAKTGAGIAWKVPSPAPGFNSPIVWGDRVFMSGGDAKRREVVCLSGKTGQILWRQEIVTAPGSSTEPLEIPDSTGFAAPTMATDGRRVYVIFANGDVAGLTLEGKLSWSRNVGSLKNPYGHATSLATWKDRLILQLDQGDSEDGKSKIVALDGRNGQLVWQRPRRVGASWASPVVFDAAGKTQIVLLSLPWAMAHSATDGAELWKVDCLSGEVTPSPIFAGGKVIVASPSDKIVAIAPDGLGDVTKTKVLWTNDDAVPDVTSPASNGELVFALTTSGMLICIDVKDGKKQWERDYEEECHASPAISGNHLYILSQKGTAVVVETGRTYKELLRTQMPDAFHASPALAADKIYLRGVTNVWCIGAGGGGK